MTRPVLDDFAGLWTVERAIEDHLAGTTGSFRGTARFTPGQDGLEYEEEGALHLGGAGPFLARRAYLWREAGGLVHVTHADGRPFHSFDPAAPEACHLCAPDRYEVRYVFADWPRWSAVWRVTGPRKDYRMQSSYRRPASAHEAS